MDPATGTNPFQTGGMTAPAYSDLFEVTFGEEIALNSLFSRMTAYKELFGIDGFLVQPHVMHLKRLSLEGETNPNHGHRTVEYSLVMRGALRYRVGDEIIEAHAGDAVFIPPEWPHHWESIEEDTLVFGFMLHISHNGRGSRGQLARLRANMAALRFHRRPSGELVDIVRRILAAARMNGGYLEEKLRCLAQEAFVELFRMAMPPPKNVSRGPKPAVSRLRGEDPRSLFERACFFIHDNSHRPLRPAEVSEHLGLSLNRLNEIFKQQGKESVGALIWNRKMFLARNLLENSNRAIKDIAASLGVEDIAYFARRFKRQTGLTPSCYRMKTRL